MKKMFMIVGCVVVLIVCAMCVPEQKVENDYLRIHIRANSNSEVDQNIKYEIKEVVMSYLTPYLCNVESKEKAIEIVNEQKGILINKCFSLLQSKNFFYSVNININNEYFPTRTYINTTLESGYYDAVIIELGSAQGDNWWCVMYPPLCFVNKNENVNQIKYKSAIYDWFKKLF